MLKGWEKDGTCQAKVWGGGKSTQDVNAPLELTNKPKLEGSEHLQREFMSANKADCEYNSRGSTCIEKL